MTRAQRIPLVQRLLIILGLAASLTIGFAGSASAQVYGLALDPQATLSAGKTSAIITGTVTCTAGHDVNISGQLVQTTKKSSTYAIGDVTIGCTGTVQTWSVVSEVEGGNSLLLQKGKVQLITQAVDLVTDDFTEIKIVQGKLV